MKTSVIIQARMGSTRLPGKVLMKIKGITILEHLIKRLKLSKKIDDIIIATTINKEDEQIIEVAEKNNVNYFAGSEKDVLERYYLAANKFKSDIIIRITSDCPLMDYEILDKMLTLFKEKFNEIDYLSNTDVVKNTFPRGFDIEIFKYELLEKIFNIATKEYEREHVTPYVYEHPSEFKLCGFKNEIDYSNYRLTVDTSEDFNVIKLIFDKCYKENGYFNLNDVINVLRTNPEIIEINKEIHQKKLK